MSVSFDALEQNRAPLQRRLPNPKQALARASRRAARLNLGAWLVIASAVFNIALCFIKTRHWLPVNNAEIVLVELTIIMMGLFLVRRHITPTVMKLVVFSVVLMVGMKLINPGLNLKLLHDFLIMYVFYKLGTMSSVAQANRLAWALMVVVLAVGFFELLFTTAFSNIFDVWSYYVDKGVIAQGTVNYSGTNLFLSGDRGAASRTFFPGIFGSHRVSSIFLEPDSLGNYAAVMFAWCISTSVGSRWQRRSLLALSLLCVVLADSRFAGGCCALMLLLRMTPLVRSRLVVFLMPVLVMLGLVIVGSLNEMQGVLPAITSDNLAGRLLFSGRVLDYWNVPQWLAVAPSQVYVADTGYAYVINSAGLPLTLLFLALFSIHRPLRREAVFIKAMISVYLATSLCIGASIFTIKTAALLWFLYGVANNPKGFWLPASRR